MEGLAVLLGLLAVAWVFVLPLAAFIRAGHVRREVAEEAARVASMIRLLRDEVAALKLAARGEPLAAPASAPEPAPRTTPAPTVLTVPTVPTVPTVQTVQTVQFVQQVQSAPPEAAIVEALPAAPAPPAARAPALAPAPAAGGSLEERIALVWLTRAGALALLLGVAWFFKYAVDNDWIGPLGRVALGALAGVAVLVAAEVVRPTTKPLWNHVLTGVGLALLYLSAYASHAFYHLVPAAPAFAAVVVVSLLGGALSIKNRAEPILVLSLLAGYAAPVLLSTGEDRAAALAGYLLVVSALGLAVSVRMSFGAAAVVALGGTATLSVGWYARFFAAADGATYHALQSRAVALGAVAAFVAQWLAAASAARRRETLQPLALEVSALLFAHVGFTALLYDSPLALGALLAGVGVLSTALLHRAGRPELLVLPLAASFVVLLGVANAGHVERPTTLLAVLGLWAGIYAAAFLRNQRAAAAPPDARLVWAALGALVAFAVLARAVLGDAAAPFGFVLVALSFVAVAMAGAFGVALVGAIAAALSVGGLLLVAPGAEDHRQLAIAALWAAAYLAPGAWELVRRGKDATPLRLAVVSGAGLGFVLLVFRTTGERESLLRAALIAAVGAVDLALGASLLPRARRPASMLLGQALALFAGAIALLFSGATVTLAWAAMAGVVAVLAAQSEDQSWLLGAGALFAAVVVRLVFRDLPLPEAREALYFATLGKEGVLREAVLANPRTLAFAGSAAAMLVSARALAKTARPRFVQAAGWLAAVAHAALAFVVVVEAQALTLSTPPPPPAGLGPDEFRQFAHAFYQSVAAQEHALSVVVTLALAGYAALLVAVGFVLREKLHRWLGLGLFAVALAKLVLWDVWHLPRLYQTLVLVALGALLLGASFLYARFGKRLVTLLRDGGPAALALLALLAAARAHAAQPSDFAATRVVSGVDAPGLYRVELDPALYRRARAGFPDVRLFGPDGEEAPLLVRAVPTPRPAERHPATLVDPVTLPGFATRAVFDLGRAGLEHSEVRLDVEGVDFLRKTRVEVSNDEVTFATLAEGALVYAIGGAGGARNTTVAYPLSDSRYVRVTLLPANDARALRITGGDVAYAPEGSRPLERRLPATWKPLPAPRPRVSAFQLDLGEGGVPLERFELHVATAAFERHATLETADTLPYWLEARGALLFRVRGAEGMSLAADGARRRYARVTIEDGDDPPLVVTGAAAVYRPDELVFRAAKPGAYALYAGSASVAAPEYDLASVLAREGWPALREATFGPLAANPVFGAAAAAVAAPRPFTERHPMLLAALLGAIVLALAAWTIRLMRRAPPA